MSFFVGIPGYGLGVAAQYHSIKIVGDWAASRTALDQTATTAVVVRDTLPKVAKIVWPASGGVAGSGTLALSWRAGKVGLTNPQRLTGVQGAIASMLTPLWPHDAQHVEDLAPILAGIASAGGRCLSDCGLLADETILRMRVILQQDVRHYGTIERLYHRDAVALRLVCALHGEGTVVQDNSGVGSSYVWASARELLLKDLRLQEGVPAAIKLEATVRVPHSLL